MSLIPKAALTQHLVCLGKTRSGKSSTLRLLVEDLLDDNKPVCIIDPKGDWWGIKSSADGKHAGYEVVIFGGKHADVPINAHSGKVVGELVATGNRPALIDLGGWMVGERTRFFIDFASTLFTRTHGHRWLVIDECHNFAPQGKVLDPDASKMLHWANRLASEGAGKGIVLISASQRPQKVHKDYLTSHETLIAKRVIHPLDRGAMKDWIDGCGDPTKGKEVLDSLAGLQRAEGWVWSPEINFGPKRVTFPMFKTYDSFAVQTGDADRKLKGWASVDLEEVKSKLAAVLEEAKLNDPRELRAQLIEKDKKIAELTYKSTSEPSNAALKKAEQEGYARGEAETAPVWFRRGVEAILGTIGGQMRAVLDALKKADFIQKELEIWKGIGALRAPAPRVEVVKAIEIRRPPIAQPVRSAAVETGAFTGPQIRVLRALAMWRALGHDTPSREMVAAVAGYKPSTGNYNNLVGGLVTVGAIGKPGTGQLSLQYEGVDDMTSDQGRDMLIGTLSGPQRRIVGALVGAGAKSRDELAADTGYQPSTGNFNNLLGGLNTIGITYRPAQGQIALSEWAQMLLQGHEQRLAA